MSCRASPGPAAASWRSPTFRRVSRHAALALLEANGIEATAKYGDAGGWAPFFAMIDGFRVLVFDDDLDAAKSLLESSDLFPPSPAS